MIISGIFKLYLIDLLIENEPIGIKQRRNQILQVFGYLEKTFEIRISKMKLITVEVFQYCLIIKFQKKKIPI